MTPSLRLAELLCARLCHELSSPLGTLAGVMEMLTEGGATAAEARNIADEAGVAVRARLRLLRAAWTGDCGPLPAEEIRAMADGLRVGRRTRINLDGLAGEFPGPEARLLLNLMLLGTEALAGNGVLHLRGTPAEGVLVAIEGPRAAWPESFAACLADEAQAWAQLGEARSLQGPFTAILAHAGALTVTVEEAATPTLRLRPG